MVDAEAGLADLIRTYARPRTFDVECPDCGALYIVSRERIGAWDPVRSELRCDSCNHAFVVGLALWRIPPGRGAKGRPLDQVPTRRTLQTLRGVLAGMVKRDSRGRSARSLKILDEAAGKGAGCTCQYHPSPLQYLKIPESEMDCPVHGGERR